MKAKNIISFMLVSVIIIGIAVVALCDIKIGSFHVPSTFDKDKGIRQGLDLVGGSVIVFEPDVDDLSKVSAYDIKKHAMFQKVELSRAENDFSLFHTHKPLTLSYDNLSARGEDV